MDGYDWNLNAFQILCLFSLTASLKKIESQLKVLVWIHLFRKTFRHSRANNSDVNDPIWPEIELVRDLIPVLVITKFDEDPIKNKRASLETPFSHYNSVGKFLDAKGHLIPKGVVRSGQNSKMLCLPSLPASVTKIGSKLKALAWKHRLPQNICHSRASTSEVNCPIRPEIKLVRDFMTVLLNSTFDEDLIKK